MESPAVSVIISVYNGEKYLKECLESVMAQTLQSIEIICVDDASTDSTPQILKAYQDRVQIITNEKNYMAGESRNRGLRAAMGEYVLFLDADDVFEPDMLEKSYRKAKICDADICIFKEDIFTDDARKCNHYSYNEILMKQLGEKVFFTPAEIAGTLFNLWNGWAWDKLFRRRFIIDAGIEFPDIQTSEDGFFVHAAMASAEKITLLNEVMVHHRTGEAGSLSNTRDRAWESCLTYLRKLREYLNNRGLFSIFERSYINWSASFLYWNYQTLGEVSRGNLTGKMRQYLLADLLIEQYEPAFFYDAFSAWFVDCIIKKEESGIPLTENERYQITYQQNEAKLEFLHKYILQRDYKAALWGAGVRGQAFAKVYGTVWSELREAYDIDPAKQGQDICFGLTIRDWDTSRPDKADLILVLNSAHLLSVYGYLQGEDVLLFDMNTYLTLSYDIDECILSCRQ